MIELPEDLHRLLKIHAARTGRPMKELVAEWLREHLAMAEGKVKP